jgi:tripartite ATP-independent transporter DctP family solute receptor
MPKRWLGWVILLGGCFWAAIAPVNAAEKAILRCADVHALGYPTVEGVRYMSRLVKEKTGGRIEIIVYPESKLGSESAVVEMVRTGALEMGRISTSQVAEVAPEFGVFVLPYLFNDNTHKWIVLDGAIGAGMLRGLKKIGLIGLCFQEAGYRSFYNSKRPIYRPEDLKGLRIRVQPNKIMIELMEFFGAYPVPMNYEEVAQALQAKILDGAENNPPSFFSSGHYRKAAYYSLDRHASIPEILLMSQKTWSSLKPADREIVAAAAQKSVAFQRQRWAEYEARSLEQLARAGCHINEVQIEKFQVKARLFNQKHAKAFKTLLDEISKEGKLGKL